MTSPEIERAVGTFVQERTGWPVRLRDPELTIHILVDENGLSTWTRRVPGPGGRPLPPSPGMPEMPLEPYYFDLNERRRSLSAAMTKPATAPLITAMLV